MGLLLAVAAPAGLLILRNLVHHGPLSWSSALDDVVAQPETYGYVAAFTICVLVVLGWVLGRKEDLLEETATTDELTGLANRRQFQDRLADEARKAARYGMPVALLLVDLDRLKEINDVGGHEAGDRALTLVGHALRRSCRETDIPARQGGDEFAVIAPSTHAREALALANRIRQVVAELAARAHVGPVSVSIGVADVDRIAPGRPSEMAAALFQAADRALYEAKTTGRDRVAVAAVTTTQVGPPPVRRRSQDPKPV